MRIAYIGDLSVGSTSKSRFDAISLANNGDVLEIDISIPIKKTFRIFRSLGWRFYKGPLINNINKFLINKLVGQFDIIWIDKGYFIHPKTLLKVKANTKKLVHYTPDVAFLKYQSKLFTSSLDIYDICYTTKSFEIELYKKNKCREVVFCTQGYNSTMHLHEINFEQKEGVIFIGLFEESRKKVIEILITNQIKVKVGGVGWYTFYLKNRNNPYLEYLGAKVFGGEYINEISKSLFGLGLLTKRFIELHTTRTFEIPACNTILITERNAETLSFFDSKEVIFFDDFFEIPFLIKNQRNHQEIATNGRNRVISDLRDYNSYFKREFEFRLKEL